MSDRPYRDNDENKERRRVSFEDDYLELLSEQDDVYEDAFGDSSNDIYIGKRNNKEENSTEDVYISKPRKDLSRDIYSDSRRANASQSQRQQPNSQKPYLRSAPVNQGDRQQQTSQRPYLRSAPTNRGDSQQPQSHLRNAPSNQSNRPQQNNKPQQNTARGNDKHNTQQVPRVPRGDEISDHEARHGKSTSALSGKSSTGRKILSLLLVVLIAFGGIFFLSANSIVSKFEKADKIEHIEDVDSLVSESHVRNILLIGCDDAKGGSSRSDSIMICSVNKQTGRITVVSILRDTHLDVPGHRESKVNAAYAWGGANLLVQTVEQNFGIKIDDYATVDFEMFTALVDGLGGIEVDVTEDEADYINEIHRYGREEKPETVPSGENVHLTGYQALWYSRIRKLDSDFNRTERQRKVIGAIVEKAKGDLNPIGIFGLVSTAKDVAPYIETTLSTGDFWNLVFSLMSCVTKSGADMDKLLVSAQLPFEGTWWYSSEWDGSSISIDLEVNRQMLYTLLYEDYEVSETETEEDTE